MHKEDKMPYTVIISDSFCKWKYELSGSDRFSIADILDVITEKTGLAADKGELVKETPVS